MIGSIATMAVVVFGGYLALRALAESEAERTTRALLVAQGHLVEKSLSNGILTGDPKAIAQLDELVKGTVVSGSVVRTKLWSQDGMVLYSDEHRLIGQRFKLAGDELRGFNNLQPEVDVSDLRRPENRYERSQHKLLEAQMAIHTPNGTVVMFEIYERFAAINHARARLLSSLAPPLVGALLVLLLFQLPLAWSSARRMQREHRERERLLASAVEASTRERHRIASDLHDGVVQDLAGVAFALAPLVDDADRREAPEEAAALRESVSMLRQGVRGMRTLLVELHPPSLEAGGLRAALSDLLSPLAAAGIEVELQIDDDAIRSSAHNALVYRVAREAVRNAQLHAAPTHVRIEAGRTPDGAMRLVVGDDGRGFAADERAQRAADGHVGLRLLEGLVEQASGTLTVSSQPGAGTTVELEVPEP